MSHLVKIHWYRVPEREFFEQFFSQNYKKKDFFLQRKKIIKNWLYWNEKLKPKRSLQMNTERGIWHMTKARNKMIDKEENIALFERRFIGADDEYVPISVSSIFKSNFDQYLMNKTKR